MRLFAAVMVLAAAGAGAQLPAGTVSADDTSKQDVASARLSDAASALEKQDYQGAATKLKALATERPKDARVLYDLGFAQERIGREADAAKSYAASAAADAANELKGEPLVALGLLDARAGRMDKAHDELTHAATATTNDPELRGRALRTLARMDEASKPDAAREELLGAVQLTGETTPDIVLSADLASQAGDDQDAESAYRRALALDKDNIDVIAGLAHSLVRQKKFAEAETLLTESLKSHAADPQLVTQLAFLYADTDKAAQAIPLLEKLRGLKPEFAANGSMTRLLARLYAMNGQYAEAANLYQALIARNPKDASLLSDLGDALIKEHSYAAAEGVLAKAVEMRDAFPTPQEWGEAAGQLAFAASKNNDPHVTLQAVAARAAVLPNSPASLFLEATAHDTLHETKAAATAYRAFLAIAGGKYPDEEFEARHRLVALEHMK